MVDALRVALLVTTDLPPDTDLAEFGRLLVDAVSTLGQDDVAYTGLLRGGVFWLDQPLPPTGDGLGGAAAEELRFAALLGHLSVPVPPGSARQVIIDARRAITAAVATRYGDLGSPPAVMAIRSDDVRERTPDTAIRVEPPKPADPREPEEPREPANPAEPSEPKEPAEVTGPNGPGRPHEANTSRPHGPGGPGRPGEALGVPAEPAASASA
ncbi:hypothetical protein FHS43_002155 [Streptosporangium becharense]|uniref:Uncharacterized protein n=1 Tax=Streptosporangium becharense TaxID=1816182 RepID=A0A7W9ME44_9ACTN|nr:hypothetical protein [Streptosporangium becharense]MBB2910892.1 hypothetical protein [Streptosporangium becharense]MBB5817587.1 hypothetical protein [Streptosporangium becharense]